MLVVIFLLPKHFQFVTCVNELYVCIEMIHARMGNAQLMGNPKYNLFKYYPMLCVTTSTITNSAEP